MSGLLGSFVFRLSTDSFDSPTNEIQWTATGDDHIDVSFAFRPEVKATIDVVPDGLSVHVWSEEVADKQYEFHVPSEPTHDEIVEIVGLIFNAALGLHRHLMADTWLYEIKK
jgi:hypothetical protein